MRVSINRRLVVTTCYVIARLSSFHALSMGFITVMLFWRSVNKNVRHIHRSPALILRLVAVADLLVLVLTGLT